MSEYKLGQEIVARSVAKVWDTAKTEWGLHEIYEADEPETCLCGHFPIIELCVLINRRNGQLATVGNCCVKKFMGLPSDLIFQAVKRVRADSGRSLNAESIEQDGGIVILNPEYGERLGNTDELVKFYFGIGDFFKQKCQGYRGYVFTGNLELAKRVGLRSSRRITFFNSRIECRLLEFELYSGSKRQKNRKETST